jgi:hypothetical protein
LTILKALEKEIIVVPCSDSSSSIVIKLDAEDSFRNFEYAKITCGREISAHTGLNGYLQGKSLAQILDIPFTQIAKDLSVHEEDAQFILYLEWDALRSAIVQYLGIEHSDVDSSRCQITSIEYTPEGIEIAEVILPPKEMPKILPCSLANPTK